MKDIACNDDAKSAQAQLYYQLCWQSRILREGQLWHTTIFNERMSPESNSDVLVIATESDNPTFPAGAQDNNTNIIIDLNKDTESLSEDSEPVNEVEKSAEVS